MRLMGPRGLVAGPTLIACAVTIIGCSSAPDLKASIPVSHVPVSSAQRAAIAHYYLTKLWTSDGDPSDPRVACPVDALGAARIGGRLRVYTVIHCTSTTPRCAEGGTDYTVGLVADLARTTIVRAQQDDAEMESDAVSGARIYPPSLRSTALNYMNYDGPAWLRNLAAKDLGCPHGFH